MRRALLLVALLSAVPALAQADGGEEDVMLVPGTEPPPALPDVVDVDNDDDGYTPDPGTAPVVRFTGYVDLGFAKATGNGTSFSPNDTRTPLDYGVDAFAPAVNSRGDVASIDSSDRFTNGFLPRSMGIGSTASLFINTASVDLRYTPRTVPLLVFARLQAMPRFTPEAGNQTRMELQQAFARLNPIESQEFAIFLGKFDSVFGIEYLENEANLRPGITPSLLARYTTGQGLGAKAFYRMQIPKLWSAVSLNVSATNGGTRVEALTPPDLSLTGVPIGAARLGYELNLPSIQGKAGVSGLVGPRNDQVSASALQYGYGADVRLFWKGLSLAGEYVHFIDTPGPVGVKETGTGAHEVPSGFEVRGAGGRVAWTLPWKSGALSDLTLYARYGHREAKFEGYVWVVTERYTVGARVDLYDSIALKAEYLFNHEISGAPDVPNDVFTASAVYTW